MEFRTTRTSTGHCRIVTPACADYDEARALYNAMIDKRPSQIFQCRAIDDIVSGVTFAKSRNLSLAIRGGGHNGAGFGSCDGGVVLDLSSMKRICIDPQNRLVSVEPGCTQGEVDHATHAHGLAVPAGIVSTTGIAGLTLGGGHGYLTRQYGLTIDNLVGAEVILADGRRIEANDSENDDLFWALKGGGGNFGIVTRFTYQAHPVSSVYAGPIFWDITHAGEVMKWYRDFLPSAPRELCSFFGVKTVPSTAPFPTEIWGRRICALINCFNGSEENGKRALEPLRRDLPAPILDGVAQMPFPALQGLFDALLPKGLQWYWKGDYVDDLSDEAIDAHLQHGATSPSELSLMHLYPIDGAVHDHPPESAAWGARSARWSMVIAGIDPDPAKAPALKKWASDYWRAVHAFNRHGGSYVNFMMQDEGEERVRAAYGSNYRRLQKVKAKYDPTNFFRVNQNITPEA